MSAETVDPKDTAVAIAADVAAGSRSATEVLQSHLDRIEATNSEINSLLEVTVSHAKEQAARVDEAISSGREVGPLAGVPVVLKDNMCTRGIPTTCSSKILEGWKPPYDATVTQLLADAGAVMVGKANCDEFAMGSSTENSAFGPSLNPLDHSRVPGGSSGGSAAAVAAGYSPVSIGSDTGGSIRQPASLCGLVGVKPTYGAVSRYGLIAFASSLDQIGPFSHTVADSALMYEVIAGHDKRDSTSVAEPALPVRAALGRGVEGLKVGIVSELYEGSDLASSFEPEVLAQTRAAAEALAAAGAEVSEVSVPSVTFGLSAYYLIAPAEASSNLARYDGVRYGNRVSGAANTANMMTATRTAGFGAEVKRRIMLGTYALSAGYYDAFYGRAQRVRTLIIDDFAAAYSKFDVLLTPTSPCVAFEFGAKDDPMTMYLNDTCTIPSNLAGHPAMSVPFGTGADGLPVGVQILAPLMGEEVMFATAAVLESAAVAATGKGA